MRLFCDFGADSLCMTGEAVLMVSPTGEESRVCDIVFALVWAFMGKRGHTLQ
jgi:hypothetical protein